MNVPGKILIYYFSGTGNAAAVSKWFSEAAQKSGVHCELKNLAKIERRQLPPPEKDIVIGFISPTHGFNYPPIMIHFLFRFPRGKGNRIFLMNTRAGMKAGKLFLPGLSGMALYFSAIILWLKKYKVIGLKSIDLPSNWISLHPGLRQKVYESIFERRKENTMLFAEAILKGRKVYRGLWPIIIDLAITPIAVLYYFIGRFGLAKTFIASSACTDCGLCESSCPVQAIKTIDSRRFWSYTCESCMKCMNQCPERAIETAHGFLALIILVLNGIVIVKLNTLFDLHSLLLKFIPDFLLGFTKFAINNAVLIFLMFLSYRIMHYLMRYRIFERIFVLSSLTHYRFWRRYRPSKKILKQ